MRTGVWSPHTTGLHRIQVVHHIKMVDDTNVKQKSAGNAEDQTAIYIRYTKFGF